MDDKPTIISISCAIREGEEKAFHEWQAGLNSAASIYPGFISSEVSFTPKRDQSEWQIAQRFKTPEEMNAWKSSPEFDAEVKELQSYVVEGSIKLGSSDISGLPSGVTEIFVTKISPGKEADFQRWNAKVNLVESQFEGFRGVYLQSPKTAHGTHWITLIRFDTSENMDRWFNSSERKSLLKESESLISSLEGHRIASPYAGWFSSLAKEGKEPPPAWKQGVIVLLTLYPIVMIELHLLAPLANYMNLSTRTFIANAISVALTTFPLIPIAIYYLGWWLSPPKEKKSEYTLKGCLLIGGIFVLQVLLCTLAFN